MRQRIGMFHEEETTLTCLELASRKHNIKTWMKEQFNNRLVSLTWQEVEKKNESLDLKFHREGSEKI